MPQTLSDTQAIAFSNTIKAIGTSALSANTLSTGPVSSSVAQLQQSIGSSVSVSQLLSSMSQTGGSTQNTSAVMQPSSANQTPVVITPSSGTSTVFLSQNSNISIVNGGVLMPNGVSQLMFSAYIDR